MTLMNKDNLVRVFDNLFSWNIYCSIGDIMLSGNDLDFGQLTVLSRYYDVCCYKDGSDKSFPFQNATSLCMWGDEHDEESGNNGFEAIIKSYELNGYNKDSRIILWRDATLANGSHRLALNIYSGFWDISAKVCFRRKKESRFSTLWYIEKGLDRHWLDVLDRMAGEVRQKLFNEGVSFVCVADKLEDTVSQKLIVLLKKNCKEVFVSRLIEGGYLFRFSLSDPQYIVRKRQLFSTKAYRLYKKIEKEFGHIIINKSFNCLNGRSLFCRYNGLIVG